MNQPVPSVFAFDLQRGLLFSCLLSECYNQFILTVCLQTFPTLVNCKQRCSPQLIVLNKSLTIQRNMNDRVLGEINKDIMFNAFPGLVKRVEVCPIIAVLVLSGNLELTIELLCDFTIGSLLDSFQRTTHFQEFLLRPIHLSVDQGLHNDLLKPSLSCLGRYDRSEQFPRFRQLC